MEEKIIKGLVCLLLILNGYLDWKKQEISLASLLVFGAAGAGANLYFHYQHLAEMIGGIGIGIFVILLAFFTKESIGVGDGLLLCVTGLFLGFAGNFRLLLSGLILCAAVMSTWLLLGVIRKEERLPLVPFLLLAFIGGIFF